MAIASQTRRPTSVSNAMFADRFQHACAMAQTLRLQVLHTMPALTRIRNLTIRSRLLLTLACGLVVLIMQATLAYLTVDANRGAAVAVVHTREVIGLADEALTGLVDTQSDYRGYLLNGDNALLIGLADNERTLETRLGDLRTLTSDNPAQVARWQRISTEVAEWERSAVEPGTSMRQQSAGALPGDVVAQLPDGQVQVNSIRAAFAEAIAVEQALVVDRSRSAEAANTLLVAVLLGGTLGIAILGLGLVLLMARAMRGELAQVANAARAIAAGDLDRRVGSVGTYEIAETAAAVDRMADALRHDVARLRAIIAAQSEIARAELHPDARFEVITQRAQELTGAAGAVVEMAEGDEMVYRAASGMAKPHLGLRLPLEGSLSGLCVQTAQTLLCEDTELDPRVNAEACRRVNVRSMVVAPLASEGKTIGVLKVLSPVEHAFSGRDVDTLQLAASLLGAALDHAQAFRDKERSEAKFRSVSESAHEAIVSADADGRIVFWNPAATRLFSYPPREMLGMPLDRLLPTIVAAGEPPAPDEVMLHSVGQRKDGSRFPVEFSLARWEAEGQAYTTGILRDITERQIVERLKDELISVVSHELRTPLTSIRGSLGLLAAGLLKTAPDTAQRMLDIAVDNTERLTRLVNDFLDLERLQTGRVHLETHLCSAVDLVELATLAVRSTAQAAKVELQSAPQPADLTVNSDRIVQVLTNLLSNAIKFSASGGVVHIWSAPDGADVLFGVRDFGRGIPADKIESIFERFQQLDPSDTRQRGGTGLGLTICRTIVEQHGGRISVESTLGGGSTFTVSLPSHSGAAQEATAISRN
jgi:PAS domain S-box-containing protein